MIQLIGKIKDRRYYPLIDFLFDRCDYFTFCVPNFGKIVINEKNAEASFYEIGHTETNDVEDFNEYKKMVDSGLLSIKKNIIKTYYDTEYLGSIYEYECETYIVKFEEATMGFLKATEGLYSWQYPIMPEDLCFFQGERCYLRSVAHENLCFIYDDSKETKKALRKIGIKSQTVLDEEPPLLIF